MSECAYLAWRYVSYYKARTSLLIAALAIVLFVPAAVESLVRKAAMELRARAATTPLIAGARASETELVLNSLYFTSAAPADVPFSAAKLIHDTDLATAIPLNARFQARGFPIVGTTPDYFRFRSATTSQGSLKYELGECVVGAEVSRQLDLAVGDHVVSTPESAFDLAGVYPLKMTVVGTLQRTGTPDDHAIFASLKTTWLIAGLGHGHDDLAEEETEDGHAKAAHAAAVTFREVTPQNRRSFHFHGDRATFPITAVVVVPKDAKCKAILLGRFQEDDALLISTPTSVIESLLATIFRVRSFVIVGAAFLSCSTLLLVTLVLSLSLRMRQAEIKSMTRLGASRMRIVGIVACENGIVLAASIIVAGALVWLVYQYGDWLLRVLL